MEALCVAVIALFGALSLATAACDCLFFKEVETVVRNSQLKLACVGEIQKLDHHVLITRW